MLMACDISDGVKGIFEARFPAHLAAVTTAFVECYNDITSRFRAFGRLGRRFTLPARVTYAAAITIPNL